jgi:signal peptidase I
MESRDIGLPCVSRRSGESESPPRTAVTAQKSRVHSLPPTRPRWIVATLAVAAAIAVAYLGARLVFIQGWVRPVRIAGGSMAEALCGAHLTVRCSDCGFPCRVDADCLPADERIVCPNCGWSQDVQAAAPHRGDRVLVDRWAYRSRAPRRWQVAAVRSADDDNLLHVKRVVGLPGERVAIRGGDLYVNGQIARKTLAELRSMAIPVHDTGYPTDGRDAPPARWRAASSSSRWSPRGTGYRFTPPDDPAATTDWLVYHHWRCIKGPWPRTEAYPVLDNYGYNQAVSRQLHQVADLYLVCRARFGPGQGSMLVRMHDGCDWVELRLNPATRQAVVRCDERPLAQTALPPVAYARGVTIEVALCDRQVLLAIAGLPVIATAYESSEDDLHAVAEPIQIGAAGGVMDLARLQVMRDIHYLDPRGLGRSWTSPRRLGPDEFFVLGDNVPISRDSRHAPLGSVRRARLLGRVCAAR